MLAEALLEGYNGFTGSSNCDTVSDPIAYLQEATIEAICALNEASQQYYIGDIIAASEVIMEGSGASGAEGKLKTLWNKFKAKVKEILDKLRARIRKIIDWFKSKFKKKSGSSNGASSIADKVDVLVTHTNKVEEQVKTHTPGSRVPNIMVKVKNLSKYNDLMEKIIEYVEYAADGNSSDFKYMRDEGDKYIDLCLARRDQEKASTVQRQIVGKDSDGHGIEGIDDWKEFRTKWQKACENKISSLFGIKIEDDEGITKFTTEMNGMFKELSGETSMPYTDFKKSVEKLNALSERISNNKMISKLELQDKLLANLQDKVNSIDPTKNNAASGNGMDGKGQQRLIATVNMILQTRTEYISHLMVISNYVFKPMNELLAVEQKALADYKEALRFMSETSPYNDNKANIL